MFMTQTGQELLQCPLPPRPSAADRRWKPSVEIAPNCPRCNSSNTKFCYYNNYSLTQPRYFCKACRRYWTKGGSLRNVPVGGGCRKNRRSRSAPTPTNRISTGSSHSMEAHQDGLNGSNGINSSNSISRSDASNIDLAVVYAKFLNQQPDSSNGVVMPDHLPREFDSSFDVLSVSDTTADAHTQFEHSGATSDPSPDANLSDGPHHIFLNEFENYEEQERFSVPQSTGLESSSYEFQPLVPPENLAVQDIYWSNSPVSWQPTSLQGYDQVITDHHHHQHDSNIQPNQLDDNWSSFDLSNFDDFPRP